MINLIRIEYIYIYLHCVVQRFIKKKKRPMSKVQ